MATQFFLRDAASDLAGAGQKTLSTTRGAASTLKVTTTTASGTNIQVTDSAGGQVLTWFTPGLNAITISGTVTVNLRGIESAAAANAGGGVLIERVNAAGVVQSTIVADSTVPNIITEYSNVADSAKNDTYTPTSTAIGQGERIKVTLKVRNVGTMGAGTVSNSIDGPTAAVAGDTYITFTENITLVPIAETGNAQLAITTAGTESRSDVYVAETFSSTQSDGLGNGSAITTARTQAGDYLVVCTADSQFTTPPTPPAGWTSAGIPITDHTGPFETYVWYLKNPAAQTTYTWTLPGGRRTIVGALVRGANGTTLFDAVSSLATGSGTSHASPSVVTTGTNRALLAFNVLRGFPTSAWSQATNWTKYNEAVGADAVTNMQVALQARTAPTAGTYSDTFTCAIAEPAIVILLAIIPAVGGGTGTAETGNAKLATTTSATVTKVAVQAGQCALALAGRSTTTKKSINSGTTTLALRDSSTAIKSAPEVATTALAMTAVGTVTTGTARAQFGNCQVPLRVASTSSKIGKASGSSQVALRTVGGASKTAIGTATTTIAVTLLGQVNTVAARQQTGTTQVPLRGSGTSVKRAIAPSTCSIALRSASSTIKLVGLTGAASLAVCISSTTFKKSLNVGTVRVAMTVTFTVQVITANPNIVIRLITVGSTIIGSDQSATVLKITPAGQTVLKITPAGQTVLSL